MKRFYSLPLAAASLSAALLAGCNGGRQSIGLVLGDPTGVSYRQELSRNEAVSVGVDPFGLPDNLRLYVDWIRYESTWQGHEFFPYWGLGVDISIGKGTGAAFRVPLGMDLEITRSGDVVLFLQVVLKVPFENPNLGFGLALGLIFGF